LGDGRLRCAGRDANRPGQHQDVDQRCDSSHQVRRDLLDHRIAAQTDDHLVPVLDRNVADAWAGRDADRWVANYLELCQEPARDCPWASDAKELVCAEKQLARHRRDVRQPGEQRWAANPAAADERLQLERLERDELEEFAPAELLAAAVMPEVELMVPPQEWPRPKWGLAT